jgi:tRNA U34 5-methylaminomethyl-2-thiouridine-forming methyltransferase MnmC
MDKDFLNRLEIAETGDGSSSLYLPELDEHYHSKHGAIRESQHVFIEKWLTYFKDNFYDQKPIKILELGFGTGLNALLSLTFSLEHKIPIEYHTIEAYPLSEEKISSLNYTSLLDSKHDLFHYFKKIHEVSWEEKRFISDQFQLFKKKDFFQNLEEENTYNIIYYDAFGSRVQPELWTEELITQIGKGLKKPGVMLTYAAKGNFKRACKGLGFQLEKLDGPPGKREMMRATYI